MKQVFSGFDEVAEVWARQSQEHVRSGNGHFWSRGPVIHSYRWPIGILFAGPDETPFCLIEEQRPSNSTATHIGLAWGAARKIAAADVVEVSTIENYTALTEQKAPKKRLDALAKLRKTLEAKISGALAVIDNYEDTTGTQAARLSEIARNLAIHQKLARSFAQNWPALASQPAFAARAEACRELCEENAKNKYKSQTDARKKRERRVSWERANPLPAAEELAQWRTGARLTLQHQPALPNRWAGRELHLRVCNGKLETSEGTTVPASLLARMLKVSVAMVVDEADEEQVPDIKFGSDRLQFHTNGSVNLSRWSTVSFEELLACAEQGAPRIYARVQPQLEAHRAAQAAGMRRAV